jgi:cytochrome P450
MATSVGTPAGPDIADFNPFGLAFRTDPEAFHAALVVASPGFFTSEEGVPSAYVASYPQASRALREFRAFSSLKPKGLPGMDRVDFFNSYPVMNYCDPPDHTRRRKVINAAFQPKQTEPLAEAAERIVDAIFDRVVDQGGRFDAVGELTKPLSTQVLLDHFLRIPRANQQIFINYFMTFPLLDKMKPGDPKPQPYLDAWDQCAAYCREQRALAHEGKCDNLIGVVARSADEGAIGEDEMTAMMITLMIGGISTVAAAAGSALMHLALHPELTARLRDDPALAAKHHEEALRIDAPVAMVLRFGTDGSEIDGTPVPQDMPVYVMLGSANRDPAVFPEPDRFSLDRTNSHTHLSFGYGIHTCIGNAITRNLVPLLTRKAIARFRRIDLADEIEPVGYDCGNPRGRHLARLMLEVA